jgi:hypothetical protein
MNDLFKVQVVLLLHYISRDGALFGALYSGPKPSMSTLKDIKISIHLGGSQSAKTLVHHEIPID